MQCNSSKKLAALNWWISLDMVTTDFGLINLPCVQAVYFLAQEDEYIILILSTDYLLFYIATTLPLIA